jgi:hypothetical protein
MIRWNYFVVGLSVSVMKSRRNLLVGNAALRHQLLVLSRKARRPHWNPVDRVVWVWLSLAWGRWSKALWLVQPGKPSVFKMESLQGRILSFPGLFSDHSGQLCLARPIRPPIGARFPPVWASHCYEPAFSGAEHSRRLRGRAARQQPQADLVQVVSQHAKPGVALETVVAFVGTT